jgi:hypothetical protein
MAMRALMRSRHKQAGGILLIFGICLLLLFGCLGVVIDLGYAYTTRASIQNAVDAAALAGARELDGTADGVARAVAVARDYAQRNKMPGHDQFVINDDDLWVGACPHEECMVPAVGFTAVNAPLPAALLPAPSANPATIMFLKVRAKSKAMPTFFMKLLGTGPGSPLASTSSVAIAVAGRALPPCLSGPSGTPEADLLWYHCQVAPNGICTVCVELFGCVVTVASTMSQPTLLFR